MASTSSRRVVLLDPRYRRFVTPDLTGLRIRIEGVRPEELEHLFLRVQYTDTDQEAGTEPTMSRSVVLPLKGAREVIELPPPRFHHSGRVALELVDGPSGRAIVDAQWLLTMLTPELFRSIAHFDSRHILFVGEQARWPRIWESRADWSERAVGPAEACRRIEEIRSAGFDGLLLPQPDLSDSWIQKLAGIAGEGGIDLVPNLLPPVTGDPGPELVSAVQARLRTLRHVRGILGYAFGATGSPWTEETGRRLQATYAAVRRTDASRPIFLAAHPPNGLDRVSQAGFEDVLVVDVSGPPEAGVTRQRASVGEGFLTWSRIDWSQPTTEGPVGYDARRDAVYRHLAVGGAGTIWTGNDSDLASSALRLLLAELRAVAQTVLRGVPLDEGRRPPNLAPDLVVWQRKWLDRLLIVISNESANRRTIQVPDGKGWWVLSEGRMIENGPDTPKEPDRGGDRQELEAWGVLVLTNDPQLAGAVPTRPAASADR